MQAAELRGGQIDDSAATSGARMVKKSDTETTAVPKSGGKAKTASSKPVNALQQPLKPSAALATVIGAETVTRGDAISKIWKYIKAEKLQDPKDGRQIVADADLKSLFGKDKISMFEMSKILSQNLT